MNGQRRKLQTQEFRVKEVPDPVVKVAGERGGTIKKNLLVAAGGVEVELEKFDFDMKFKVQSFNLYTWWTDIPRILELMGLPLHRSRLS